MFDRDNHGLIEKLFLQLGEKEVIENVFKNLGYYYSIRTSD